MTPDSHNDTARDEGSIARADAQSGADSRRPVITIMHASVGSGHRAAANAIAQAVELLRGTHGVPADVNVDVLDVLDFGRIRFDGNKTAAHRAAANAIAQAVELLRGTHGVPADVNVDVLDVLDFGRIRFDGNKTAAAFTGATRPIYDVAWRFTLTGRFLWGGGSAWSKLMFTRPLPRSPAQRGRSTTWLGDSRLPAVFCGAADRHGQSSCSGHSTITWWPIAP